MAEARLPNFLVQTALLGLGLSACFDRPPEPGFADWRPGDDEASLDGSDSQVTDPDGASGTPTNDDPSNDDGENNDGADSQNDDQNDDQSDDQGDTAEVSTGSADSAADDGVGETDGGQEEAGTTGDANDLDNDGEEGSSETDDTKVLCDGHWQADRLWIRSATELAALEGCTHVEGDLYILGCNPKSIPDGGDIPNCDPRDPIHSLSTLSSLRHIEGGLWIDGLESLTSLSGLAGVISLESVTIQNNRELTAVSGFDALVGEVISIEVTDNPELLSITGFSGVTRLRDKLSIDANERLELIEGFDRVTRGGDVMVRVAAKLSQFDAFSRLKEAEYVVFMTTGLANLRFDRLETIEAVLQISDSKSMHTLAFPALEKVGNLTITGLPAVEFVDMRTLVESKQMELSNNGMPNLAGFSELKVVEDHVKITYNTGFTNAQARDFVDGLDVGGSVIIQNNGK